MYESRTDGNTYSNTGPIDTSNIGIKIFADAYIAIRSYTPSHTWEFIGLSKNL